MSKREPVSAARPDAGRGGLQWLLHAVLRARSLVLLAAMALTVFSGLQLTRLRTEWNEREELATSDPEFEAFEEFLEAFGGEEVLVVVLRSDEVFSPEFLDVLMDLTDELRDTPNALGVVSLATVPVIRQTATGVGIEPLLADLPETDAGFDRLRAEVLEDPLWVDLLVSADGTTACIHVLLPAMHTDSAARVATVAFVDAVLERHRTPGITTAITGLSPLARDVLDSLSRDFRLFLWLTPAAILLFLALAFRTGRGVVAPVLVIVLSVVWTLGIMAACGGTLNYASVMLPTLLSVVSLSYVIHFLSAYHDACGRGGTHRQALVQSMGHIVPACFMAAVTTAIGFAALGVSELRSIRELGFYAALGVMLAFTLATLCVPVLLSWFPLPKRAACCHRGRRRLRRGLLWMASGTNRDVWKTPLVLGVLALLALSGMRRIKVESQMYRHLPAEAPSMVGLRLVEEHLAGFHMLEVAVHGEPGTFNEPWALEEIERIHRHIRDLEGVDKVLSVNTLLREVHRLRYPEAQGAYGLPESSGQVAEYRLLFSMAGQERWLHSMVTPDAATARLSARIPTMTTAQHLKLFAAIEAYAARNLDPRLTLQTTGMVKLVATKLHTMINSLVESFGLSFLLIALLLTVQLRSVKAGLVAMIPNVLPILAGFGLMGYLGIPLSAGTVTIPAVGIGLTVDHTIHFLLRYRREGRKRSAPVKRIRYTLLGVGRAMVYASLMLAAGFSILLFSEYNLNREFGLLTAFIMLAALAADLAVTPFVTRVFRLLPVRGSPDKTGR